MVGTVLECGSDASASKQGERVTMGYSCACGDNHMCSLRQTVHCETTRKAEAVFLRSRAQARDRRHRACTLATS
ncbi:MAG: hypothetical protein EXR86_10085 [Gammaproteobacteria bacterium]|nr:hypothetical protein [Gammaproteobacteria bacterium]